VLSSASKKLFAVTFLIASALFAAVKISYAYTEYQMDFEMRRAIHRSAPVPPPSLPPDEPSRPAPYPNDNIIRI
jgi:hypothetical protein